MAEPKTDLLGREMPKEKPGPKEKYWAKRNVLTIRLSSEELVKLNRLVKRKGTTISDYIRGLIHEEWKRFGHLTGRAPKRID